MHLIIAEPGDDAERKRVDYQVEKHGTQLGLVRANANWLLTESDDIASVAQELAAKLGASKVRVYRLVPVDVDVETTERIIEREFPASRSTVESAILGFIMVKRKGVLRPLPGVKHRIYDVSTNKGKAEIRVLVTGGARTSHIRLEIEGPRATVDHIVGTIEKDLELFGRGLRD